MYFEFRSKPSLITVICMNPRSLKICCDRILFSHTQRGYQFLFLDYFIIFRFFCCYFTLLLIFTKIILLFIFYYYYFFSMKIIFIFSCSGMFRMFRNVPCSGFYRRLLTGGLVSSVVQVITIWVLTISLNKTLGKKFPRSVETKAKRFQMLREMIIRHRYILRVSSNVNVLSALLGVVLYGRWVFITRGLGIVLRSISSTSFSWVAVTSRKGTRKPCFSLLIAPSL